VATRRGLIVVVTERRLVALWRLGAGADFAHFARLAHFADLADLADLAGLAGLTVLAELLDNLWDTLVGHQLNAGRLWVNWNVGAVITPIITTKQH